MFVPGGWGACQRSSKRSCLNSMEFIANCDVCGKERKLSRRVPLPVYCFGCRPEVKKAPTSTSTGTRPPIVSSIIRQTKEACDHRGLQIGSIKNCGCGSGVIVYECNLLKKPCMRQKPSKEFKDLNVIPLEGQAINEVPIGCNACDFYISGRARWIQTKEEHEPIYDNLVISIAIGDEAAEVSSITSQYHMAYAQKIDAQYLLLTDRTQSWWGLEKFRVKEIAKKHKRVLFIDADAIIHPDAPNIFDIVPEGTVGIFDDWDKLNMNDFVKKNIEILNESQNMQCEELRCLNSGFVVFDGAHADIWSPPPNVFTTTKTIEQSWVENNIRKKKLDIFPLSEKWNCQYWWDQGFEQDSYVKHMSNAPHSIRMQFSATTKE